MPFYIEYLAFNAHIALALALIALVAGCFIFTKACAEGYCCKALAKIVGVIVMILAILSTICILYLSIQRCCKEKPPIMPPSWHHPPTEQPGE